MSASFRDLKSLQKIWYEKLKESGFEDAEDTSSPHMPLKAWHSFRFNGAQVKQEAAETYYARATELLHSFKFLNDTHRRIWELHSEGWSKRQIERAIVDETPSYKREQIGVIIKRIAREIT